jgi:hypothetical protein
MPASFVRFMVWEGGVEVTIISTFVSMAGWVMATPMGADPLFSKPSI